MAGSVDNQGKIWYKHTIHGIMESTKKHSRTEEAYTMKSIAEIFDNGNQMIDSIHNFFGREFNTCTKPKTLKALKGLIFLSIFLNLCVVCVVCL